MKHSISSPGSSSEFHIGTAVPFLYQDFLCRFQKQNGNKFEQIIAVNEIGLRKFSIENYLQQIGLLSIDWNKKTIIDSEKNNILKTKNILNKLISEGVIYKKKIDIFVCKNHKQIFLSPGKISSLRLVHKESTQVPAFKQQLLGDVSVWKQYSNFKAAFVGSTNDFNGEVDTPFGRLPVKKIEGLNHSTIFFKEEGSQGKVLLKETITQEVYKCNFCGETLIPSTQWGWVMDYCETFDISKIKGVIPKKQWETLIEEISCHQIISRDRKDLGIKTVDINNTQGILNTVLDPEFFIQFLPIVQSKHDHTAIESMFFSMNNQKFIVNSMRLYNMFDEQVLKNMYVVGIFRGKNKLPMRKSNHNTISLKKIVEKYGIDAVRLYYAKANLLIKSSRIYDESSLKGYKKFVDKTLNQFNMEDIEGSFGGYDTFPDFSAKFEKKMNSLDFGGAVDELKLFFTGISGHLPKNAKEYSYLSASLSYLKCFCPILSQEIQSVIEHKNILYYH